MLDIRECYLWFLTVNSIVVFLVSAFGSALLEHFEFERSLIYEKYLFREVERRCRILRSLKRQDRDEQK